MPDSITESLLPNENRMGSRSCSTDSSSVEDLEVGKHYTLEYGSTSPSGSFSSLDTVTAFETRQSIQKNTIDVPQGRHLGVFSTMILFISRILGSGIFSVPSAMYVNCGGNTLLYFLIWSLTAIFVILWIIFISGIWCLVTKYRGKKNFLEQTYDRPRLMMGVTFGIYTVLSGMSLSSAIVFGKYILYALGFDHHIAESYWCKLISIFIVIAAVLTHGLSIKRGVQIQNALGSMKLILIMLMYCTGLYALLFYSPSESYNTAWNSSWTSFQDKNMISTSSIAAAFISSFFCFSGWDSVHAVTSEIKNPTRTLKIAGPLSLFVCLICYLLMNVAYLKLLTYEEIKNAGPLVGQVLYTKLFGAELGGRLVSLSIALSSVSNMLVVIYGTSRMNQEVFKEGYLPYSKLFLKEIYGNPTFPAILVCGGLTAIWILILPSQGPSFDYLISMEGWGNQVFLLLIAIGLFIYRYRHRNDDAEDKPTIKASPIGVLGIILVSSYMVIAPFIGDQSNNSVGFLPPYQVTSLLIISLCFFVWLVRFSILPWLFNYTLKPKLLFLKDGLLVTQWVKKYSY
ncbi:Mup3p NDAI_0H00180 [Naumovozyma dairenensis CBS 421]|uniref:Amino acid permease/ SLC12A domain-containing protein n=1 Tax=Naumovozyma dairenensis (strain ATCC 10597 / BCRC 20456 / CBS 421 / NBRC 0211 / NRRL Y-12639) TaxID=1071378 RepID=G0WEI1_NAUDC|nr:hypothetical protein NDAI_0H00180 [Naumovozyma dairenensis CBS 421]CCD26192.1 hypothetical protein NDAI_0H00180 [Naumovozyma dairenensis CBS 421]